MSNEQNADNARRNLLKGIAIVPVAMVLGRVGTASAAMLSPNDPLAKSLGYTEHSKTPGQHCAICNLYLGGSAPKGKCQIFGDKEVVATGWCKSWVKKA
jgi:hypothetical protein